MLDAAAEYLVTQTIGQYTSLDDTRWPSYPDAEMRHPEENLEFLKVSVRWSPLNFIIGLEVPLKGQMGRKIV